jgi:hypothetical protein
MHTQEVIRSVSEIRAANARYAKQRRRDALSGRKQLRKRIALGVSRHSDYLGSGSSRRGGRRIVIHPRGAPVGHNRARTRCLRARARA